MDTQAHINGVVTGALNWILRAEGALVFAAAVTAYAHMELGWLLFALLFFVPDIFMLGYLRDNRMGAISYNFGHTYILPAIFFGVGWMNAVPLVSAISLIWIGHIGFDRMLGYGLKYEAGFKLTHLSWPIY
jgi:hypothetical protein